MRRHPLVSVIVPAYNVGPWIGQSLDSLLDQSYSNLEVIVINDGSTDSTGQILEQYQSRSKRIRCEWQPNKGQSVARNRAMEIAMGDILMFLDADDWFHRDTVSSVVGQFTEGEIDLVVFGCAKYFDQDRAWATGTDDFYWRQIELKDRSSYYTTEVPEILALYPLPQMKALSRNFVNKKNLRFLEGVKYEDNSFHLDVFKSNPKVSFVFRRLHAWRVQRPGQTTANAYLEDCRKVMEYMLVASKSIPDDSAPYLLVAISRLMVAVAAQIKEGGIRYDFLNNCSRQLSVFFDQKTLDLLDNLLQQESLHPGDFLLARSVFTNSKFVALSLDKGVRKMVGGAGVIATTLKAAGSFRIALKLLRNMNVVWRYSKGKGSRNVHGLG